MAKYRVVGTRTVDGVKPGGVLEVRDGSPLNVAALLAAGHLEPVPGPLVGEEGPQAVAPKSTGNVVKSSRPRSKDDDK